MRRKLEFNLVKRVHFGRTSLFKFPSPPKPRFPSFRGAFGNSAHGGGFAAGFGSTDFKTPFLKFMSEAGERLGKAAAEEIEKVHLQIGGAGTQTGQGQPVSGKQATTATPGQQFAANNMRQFLPNGQDFAKAATVIWQIGLRAASFIAHVPGMAADTADSQRRFANVSPAMLGVFNESDIRGQRRDIVSGERLAPTNRDMLKQLDRFRDNAAQLTDGVTQIKNFLFTQMLSGINSAIEPLFERIFGKRQSTEALPFLQKFQDMQRNDVARRENLLANAMREAPSGWSVRQDPITGIVTFIPDPDFIGPAWPPWKP